MHSLLHNVTAVFLSAEEEHRCELWPDGMPTSSSPVMTAKATFRSLNSGVRVSKFQKKEMETLPHLG